MMLLLMMLIGAGRITRRVRLDRGGVDRPRVREGPKSPHPARGGGARHDAAPASSDTAHAVDAYEWCTTNGDGLDGATRGEARGGAGRVGRDAARERERSGPRPRGGEDRGGHGVAATGGFLRYEWAFVNTRFEFESDKTNAAV